ncbi:MAG: lamin tail domain-containing protein [Verrucomicrobia bacterium]|nr:lamin tail domain-containing protein [Verrucomicrobiota bacterium]MBI3869007.1 lamin tail domain-containing protein [Verrucomicrobiota bacterium]
MITRLEQRVQVAAGGFALAVAIALSVPTPSAAAEAPKVVINEIHFNPADKRPLEFVELHNAGAASASLAGWSLGRFVFPSNASIGPGGFAVVAADPAAFAKEFGFQPQGPLPGRLSHRGERLHLKDASGRLIDEVKYGVGFPWPTAANGAGSSMERVSPLMASSDPGAWRGSGYPAMVSAVAPRVFIPAQDPGWRWRKGTNEASTPRDAWRRIAFSEDASWQTGRTSIGYGDDDDNTLLTDMQGRYSSLFLRHAFVVNGEPPGALLLRVRVDDGCVVWLNGSEVKRWHIRQGEIPFDGVAENHEAGDEFEEALIADASRVLVRGTNLLAVQVFNAGRNSSDLSIDAELRASDGQLRSRRPTPGATNSVVSLQLPPSITAVTHAPQQPKSGEPVVVSARVTASSNPAVVTLRVQWVEPGAYIRKTDDAYARNWQSLPMRDDGKDPDVQAGDGVYTARVPAEEQRHRRLARYRVAVSDRAGGEIVAPFADDDSPNFAWFVYDGVPGWKGASEPGRTPATTFSPEFLTTLPVYHLLARSEDVERSQWDGSANRKRFLGTLVYDGRAHDHVQFHNRGTGSAYISGKNKWGFKFPRSHELGARDVHGQPYNHPWDSLNLNPGLSTPYLPVLCGIAGLDEAVSFRSFQLAGVPAANTHWIHFRVIDQPEEASAKSQYAGDLWGLYLAVQDVDGSLLRERGLPDGNLYSMQSGRKHLARGAVSDGSDWNEWIAGVRAEHPAAWWKAHLDLEAYYSFHSINRVIGNVDLRPDGNHGYYHRPDGRWAPFPWDHDMMFVPRFHQPGHIDAIRCLNAPELKLEFQNRAREILDLFCSDPTPEGGQAGQLVSELSRVLMPRGFTNDWGQLDAAVWNWNPRQNQKGIFYVNPAQGQHFGGGWQRLLSTPDLAGFCKYLVEFATDSRRVKNYAPNDGDQHGYGFGFLAHEAKDDSVPSAPSIRYTGPARHPAADLSFEITPFVSPGSKASCEAVQWRVGRIGAAAAPGGTTEWRYELEPFWTSDPKPPTPGAFRLPPQVCREKQAYRVRARYRDNTGRWSHWSAATQFVTEDP